MNFRKEHTIYTAIWAMLYASPVVNIYTRMAGNPRITFSWGEIFHAWAFTSIWLVMFAIHNFLLLPILLKKRKTGTYLCLSVAILLAGTFINYMGRPKHRHIDETRMEAEWKADSLAYERVAAVRLGDGRYCSPQNPMRRKPLDYQPIDPLPMLGPGELVAFFGGLLLMGMNLGVKLFFKLERDSIEMQLVENQNLEHQLAYLRYQINPHFYMNTLNNIHALVDINPERAKTNIVELSKMLRYVLYDANRESVSLKKEIEFLRHYFRLMSLRFTDDIKTSLTVSERMTDCNVPPLLLIIFAENAFKHGISYSGQSFVEVSIDVVDGNVVFTCSNSKHTAKPTYEKGGVGLVNVRKRLDLLYDTNYKLEIKDSEQRFDVKLVMPVLKERPQDKTVNNGSDKNGK